MKADWKFFLIEITYLLPAEQLSEIVIEHRAFLQAGYDQGWLLLSGPQVPPTGGIILAKAPSLAALESLFSHDPYQVHKVATYRFVAFDPVKRQSFLHDWINA